MLQVNEETSPDSPASRRVGIDVSHLPETAFDWRAPVWWGNTLLMLIETTTIVLLLITYFYLMRNFEQWPPPRVNRLPILYKPLPDLTAATFDVGLMVASCLPMYLISQAARRMQRTFVTVGIALMFLVTLACTILRFEEFFATHFKWNDNAYGSIVWTILGMHLTYLLAALGEFFIMGLWIVIKGLDDKHALDVTLAGGFWYWVAGTGLAVYVVVFILPRFL